MKVPSILFTAILAGLSCAEAQHRLDVEVMPCFGPAPLAFDTLGLETGTHRSVSVTRCDLLLSAAALQREDGGWIGMEKWSAYLGMREGKTRFALPNIPEGKFKRLRFHIGLSSQMNHGDPSRHAPRHPLNPLVNGMHWGWQGGYVFAALEGRWRGADGAMGGYSYHLANDEHLMTVELPVTLDLTRDQTLHLTLDLRAVLKDVEMAEDNSTTHSRPGDGLAGEICTKLSAAFSVGNISPTPSRAEVATKVNARIAEGATPYRFTYPAGFPRPDLPVDNPLTEEGVVFGRKLFHDTRLSGNGTQSCASCHIAEQGLSDPRRYSIGAFGDKGTRQAMPLFNLAWKSSYFWDGRAPTLRAQVLQPIGNPIEMHASLPQVVGRLSVDAEYRSMALAAFGSEAIDSDAVARALEQFLLTLVSADSKFDRAMRGEEVLTEEEERGARLFNTEYDPGRGRRGADCFHCHGGPMFQSMAFANNGLDAGPKDAGRSMVTGFSGDRGKFAVPTMRNIALTAPYMHDGRFATLEEVIGHYSRGVARSDTLDANLAKHPVGGIDLSPADKRALVAFLRTLTDEHFPTGK
ncbi:cytochrome C peroxidase [Luteolibacter ambystomatis]|uniref:Cytochrome C peroxidase n=1 Tax=Luteolibacter ambystomatis TaxID=2824561 RepID=A0A975G954_9BACT|nr:MbnP family protein [Luteolibacter ambystomatis]QUE51384.1 cytochrome C peroxidase [Luteolibacter ambystomatis]